jgi:cardiolipin synthase
VQTLVGHPVLSWSLGGVLVALDVAAIAVLLYRGRGVERTLAWLFAILAFPGVGSLAYFAVANPRVRKLTRRKRAAHRAVVGPCSLESAPAEPDGGIMALVERATDLPSTRGNRVDVLVEDDLAFQLVEETLESAQCSIWAEYYLIRRDETGRRFLELLAARVQDGIDVKLLYDSVGSLGLDRDRLCSQAAGGCVAFHPVNPFRRRWAVHLRNHRKLIVVDGKTAFTGGMNIGDEYSGRARRRGSLHFKDTHLRLEGPCVQHLEEVFREDWLFASGEELAASKPSPLPCAENTARVAVVPSGPDQERNASHLVYFAAIARAQNSIRLTSPYFVPDESMLLALITAALRGVDVRILVPEKPDAALVGPASRSYFAGLLRGGVRIFEYLPAMLHAKTLVVDDVLSIVGSANLDIRSFRLNFELGALVEDRATAGVLTQRFDRDLKESREVVLADVEAWSVARRIGTGAARLLSPLL